MVKSLVVFSVSLIPVLVGILILQLDKLNPVPYPVQKWRKLVFPKQNNHMLNESDKIGDGVLLQPEDISYDPKSGLLYTGCGDGWIHRFNVKDSGSGNVVPEKWVNTGGRPLGIAHGLTGEVIVADAYKGLLNISQDSVIQVLTDEAEGLKFKLTNAVDIGPDGTLYFTDSSYFYSFPDFDKDLLQGKPYGRLLSYNPLTKQTKVLLKDLHFPNGVAVSVDKSFIIFCETPLMMCKRYYIEGSKKGSVDVFIDSLPGTVDNIRYDGEGHYWIGLNMKGGVWSVLHKHPILRKLAGIVGKEGRWTNAAKGGGILSVDLEGKPLDYYTDSGPDLYLIPTGLKIGDYLYCGSMGHPYIIRIDLRLHPAH